MTISFTPERRHVDATSRTFSSKIRVSELKNLHNRTTKKKKTSALSGEVFIFLMKGKVYTKPTTPTSDR